MTAYEIYKLGLILNLNKDEFKKLLIEKHVIIPKSKEMGKIIQNAEEKNATLQLSLRAQSGYNSDETVEISPNQWGKIMRIITDNEKKIDWQVLREKYFQECVMMEVSSDKSYNMLKINRAPHDLFEWFKLQVDSYCL
jgi:hypothetical protein